MYPENFFNPNANGTVYFQKLTNNLNNFNNYRLRGFVNGLTPNRQHKIYFCDTGGTCGSDTSFDFTTSSSGYYSFDTVFYGHNDNYRINSIRIWQPYFGPIPPTDPTVCPFVTLSSYACLRANP
jgi:hypothetical protein